MPNAAKPAYVEFRLGDYQHELGIIDRAFAPARMNEGPGGAILLWHVDDVRTTFERLLASGATDTIPSPPRGESGFVTASVVDPFGNGLGIMSNPHYLKVIAARPEKT